MISNHDCAKNCYAGYFEAAEQIRVGCVVCDKIIRLIDVNIPIDIAEYRKHAVGKNIHNCLAQVQARYVKGEIIIDCLYCGYPIERIEVHQ